ncbi:MAG: hypothetical protein COB49_00570 [Alphaproteobacteria bacterium]|nr:MAG: hypothetical protein COB49_00570 [Alphaproteobacteria bacterium]
MISIRTSTQGLATTRRSEEQVKADGWHGVGVLAIHMDDDRLTDFERQFLENLGTEFYGERCAAPPKP